MKGDGPFVKALDKALESFNALPDMSTGLISPETLAAHARRRFTSKLSDKGLKVG